MPADLDLDALAKMHAEYVDLTTPMSRERLDVVRESAIQSLPALLALAREAEALRADLAAMRRMLDEYERGSTEIYGEKHMLILRVAVSKMLLMDARNADGVIENITQRAGDDLRTALRAAQAEGR